MSYFFCGTDMDLFAFFSRFVILSRTLSKHEDPDNNLADQHVDYICPLGLVSAVRLTGVSFFLLLLFPFSYLIFISIGKNSMT